MKAPYFLAAGALLLTGCDFAGSSEAIMAPIARIEASNLPSATGDSADLFFEVQDANGKMYFRSAPQAGASTDSVAVTLDNGFSLPTPTSTMYVAVYDYETSLQFSKLLARSRGFSVAELTGTPLELEDAPFKAAGESEATFTVTRGSVAQ